MPVAVHKPGHRPDPALCGDGVGHFGHECVVGEKPERLFRRGKDIGHDKQGGRWRERGQVAACQTGHLDLCVAQLFDVGLLVSHGAAIKCLDANGAAGLFFHDLLEFFDARDVKAAQRVGCGGPNGHFFIFGRGRAGDAAQHGQSDDGQQYSFQRHHHVLLMKVTVISASRCKGQFLRLLRL